MTKISYYCTGCANNLDANDEMCAGCGREAIDANRIIHLQSAGKRSNRKRPRGAASPAFAAREAPQAQEPRIAL
jgi:hypothetical protein